MKDRKINFNDRFELEYKNNIPITYTMYFHNIDKTDNIYTINFIKKTIKHNHNRKVKLNNLKIEYYKEHSYKFTHIKIQDNITTTLS